MNFLKESYFWRYLLWNTVTNTDYKKFPYRLVNPGAVPSELMVSDTPIEPGTVTYRKSGRLKTQPIENLMASTGATSFIVMKNDRVIYEKYFNGHHRDSINRSYSVAKSITSALVGIAIDEGLIGSVDDPITTYLPEFKSKGYDAIRIKHLLSMCSGLKYTRGIWPWDDKPRGYHSPDCRKLMLNTRLVYRIGETFHYNEYNLHLLAMILERVTGGAVSSYLEQKLWQPLGMEYPALFTIDNEHNGLEHAGSGINARAIDYARFARLFLNKGNWNGQQLISEKWITESTSPEGARMTPAYFSQYDKHNWGPWFKEGNHYYKYLWWGIRHDEQNYDYFALGVLGQVVYISPSRNLVMVRMSTRWGGDLWWPSIMKTIATGF